MHFLIIPSQGFTEYLTKRAKKFGGIRSSITIHADDNHLSTELTAIIVIKSERRHAEKINQQRTDNGLPDLFIVEIPYPKISRKTIRSPVRARISKILEAGPSHGYAIYQKYVQEFGASVSMRLIYYHLHRGLKDKIFETAGTEEKKGDFSWGNKTIRKLYKLSES
ncbi:MAG: hypothetical protein GOV00_03955 [Candidatus Altiarchaeota archaeon]|nr:hypothetical protein [Candidatus Altiarchaeota archaeon]